MKKAIIPILIILVFLVAGFFILRKKAIPKDQESENERIDKIEQERAKQYSDSAKNSHDKADSASQALEKFKENPSGHDIERRRLDSIIRSDVARKRGRTS